MVKKLFATIFIGSTALASIAGVVFGGNSFNELKAIDDRIEHAMTFTGSNASRVSYTSYQTVFKLTGKTAVTNTDYETNGTIKYDDAYSCTIGGDHIFSIEKGQEVTLDMSIRLVNVPNFVQVTISGTNNEWEYSKNITGASIGKNSWTMKVELDDLDYRKDGTTDIAIDTISVTYTC